MNISKQLIYNMLENDYKHLDEHQLDILSDKVFMNLYGYKTTNDFGFMYDYKRISNSIINDNSEVIGIEHSTITQDIDILL